MPFGKMQVRWSGQLQYPILLPSFVRPGQQQDAWSPSCKINKCKSIPMTPRVTHTRLPEGRQDFKLHAEGKVRLGELADLTVGLVGGQWESKLTNGVIMKAGGDRVERSVRKGNGFTGIFGRKAQWTYPSRVDEVKDEVFKGAGVWNFPYS